NALVAPVSRLQGVFFSSPRRRVIRRRLAAHRRLLQAPGRLLHDHSRHLRADDHIRNQVDVLPPFSGNRTDLFTSLTSSSSADQPFANSSSRRTLALTPFNVNTPRTPARDTRSRLPHGRWRERDYR